MPPIFNFNTVRPASECNYLGSYVVIPAFSYVGPIWKGVSEAIIQFNYTADRIFVLKRRPTMPSGANFVPVIKYRVGMTVFRYKLWQNAGEVMPNVPLYTGQIIKANFVIEIWNTATANAITLTEDLNIELGIRNLPETNYSSLADEQEGEDGVLVTPAEMISNSITLETTGLLARYTANGWSSGNLLDAVGGFNLTINGAPALSGTYVNPNAPGGQFYPIVLDAGNFFNGASPFAAGSGDKYLVCLCRLLTWSAGEILFGTMPAGINAVQCRNRTASPRIAPATGGGPTYGTAFQAEALNTWMVLVLTLNPITQSYLGLGNNQNSSVGGSGLQHAAELQIGPANMEFADMLVFDSTGDIDNAVDYLLNARGFGDAVPTEPTGNIAWLDND